MDQPEIRVFQIAAQEVGLRLDAYLASQVDGWSRARLQRLIESEDVLVNGKPSKPSYKLRANDEIEVELTAAPTTSFAPEPIPIEIVYEDDTLVVVNKPAGLVVHPAAGIHSGTLANALAYHFQQLPGSGAGVRPGIVHRLDRDTSGLLVVAKTEAALEHLSDQFRDRTVFKSYVALVHGRVNSDTGRIDQPLARDASNRTRMAVVRGGRSALSLYRVRQRFNRFTLLDVELKTGRTHQIRVHLAWLKHPVVGDETYGGGRDNTIQDAKLRAHVRNLGRHFLHAEILAFTHPQTNERVEFGRPLPPELTELLKEIAITE
ncbi:MAG TPA: RluA family pseudouridine synthase [Pyrinomonadaceae bacterium]|jgi:23S rRNA pseudouridine1911/1915/1917 synthase|nr:RluA family pseudouridine synthase [Pyrinomonadaceae bacterium]